MKNSELVYSSGEVIDKPFDGLLAIVGRQLDPGIKVSEVSEIPVVVEEKLETPMTFSAIVSSPSESEKISEDAEIPVEEDLPLPDLKVAALDEAAIKEKIQITKKWSEDAGETIIICEEGLARLDELESDPDSAFSATTLRKQRETFERKIKSIYSYPNKAAVDHAIFSAMLTRLRKANTPDEGFEAMEKTEEKGRFFRPTEELKREVKVKNKGKWPPGTKFLPYEGEQIVYFSNRGDNPSKPSDGQKALEAEVGNMVERIEKNQVTQMAKQGKRNLIRLKKGVPGFYYDHARKTRDEKNGKKRLPGDLLVEVFDKNDRGEGKRIQPPFVVIKIAEATGSFSWLIRAMTKAGLDYIPHYWLEKGVSEKMEESKQKIAWNVVNCLKARIYNWENSQRPNKTETAPVSQPVN